MRFPSLVRAAVAISALSCSVGCSQAAPAPTADGQYQLVDLSVCKKPRVAPPAPPQASYEAYGFRRRFLNLDGSGYCVLMDFWTARLGGSAATGMRTLEQRFMRVVGGNWHAFETSLSYFPHALKARSDGKLYLIDAPTKDDIGDIMVLDVDAPRVFTVAGWQNAGDFAAELILQPVHAKRAEVLLALAAQLDAGAKGKSAAERERIRLLTTQANKTGQ